ncbi:unnamed protein product [Schistosoma margrebowiei]|uniref:RRM domain-containing protein n=1 Tax=Schistosoma margrebowiei TaxID=48269 RepID=A0AA84Z706_9TREM|nr:unnamed protein product [Schistosoma margrebowiei]
MKVKSNKPLTASICRKKCSKLKRRDKTERLKKLLQSKAELSKNRNETMQTKSHDASDSVSVGELGISLNTSGPRDQLLETAVSRSELNEELNLDDTMTKNSSGHIKLVDSKCTEKLTKSQRKRHKKQEMLKLRKAAKASVPKPEPKEPRTSSSVVLPERKAYVSSLDTDEKLLDAIRNRLVEMYQHTLTIRPLPRNCPVSLIKDLFPSSVNVRIPQKCNSRFGFVKFRNHDELVEAQKSVSGKLLNGKQIQIQICSLHGPDNVDKSKWTEPLQRKLSDFDMRSLHVLHLPRATTRFDLAQVFPKAVGIRMPTYDDGSCRGYCTLTYHSRHIALKDFELRHGTFIHGESIYVMFLLKNPKKISMRNAKRHASDIYQMNVDSTSVPHKEKCAKAIVDHPIPMSIDSFDPEFKIAKSPATSGKPVKKKSKIATVQRDIPDPLINKKYQLKEKSVKRKSSSTSIFDSLFQSSTGANDKKKKKKNKSNIRNGRKFKK